MTQIVTELPAAAGSGRRLHVSAAARIEDGARAMLIMLPGAGRLDVVPGEDMVRMIVRTLGERTLVFAPAKAPGPALIQLQGTGELSLPPVGSFNARIAIDTRDGPELARVQIGSIRHPERGLVALTAQAIVDAELL